MLTKKEQDWLEQATVAGLELHQYIVKLAGRPLRGRETKKLTELLGRVLSLGANLREAV